MSRNDCKIKSLARASYHEHVEFPRGSAGASPRAAAQNVGIPSPRWDWIWKSTWAPSMGALGGELTLLSPGGGDQTAPRGSAWEGGFVYSRNCQPLTLFSLDIQIRVLFTPS